MLFTFINFVHQQQMDKAQMLVEKAGAAAWAGDRNL